MIFLGGNKKSSDDKDIFKIFYWFYLFKLIVILKK